MHGNASILPGVPGQTRPLFIEGIVAGLISVSYGALFMIMFCGT